MWSWRSRKGPRESAPPPPLDDLEARPTALTVGPLARFVTWNVLGNGTSLAIGFVASVVLARELGPGNRGLLALMLSVSTVALVVVSAGMEVAVVFFSGRRPQDGPAILGNCLAHATLIAAVLVPAVYLLHPAIADAVGGGQGGRLWAAAAALVPITFLDWTTHSQLQGTLRFGALNVLVVLQRLAYAVALVLLLTVAGLGVSAGLIATAIGSAVMIAGALPPILRLGRPRLDLGLLGRMLRYGLRAEPGAILQFATGRLDVIVLGFFRPLSEVGYYIVAQAIAELVLQVPAAFQWSGMALLSQEQSAGEQAGTTAAAVRHGTLVTGVATVVNAGLGPLVIILAYGHEFHGAVAPMLVLLPGIWLLGVGLVVQGDLGGRQRPGLASTLAGLATGATVVLDLALIPPFGVIGAAVASTLSYIVYGVASVIALTRVTGIPVRSLVLPTRADLAGYLRFARHAVGRLRGVR